MGDVRENVAANLAVAARYVGLPATRIVTMGAAHGSAVARVDSPGHIDGVDALITSEPNLALLALGADCAVVALSAAATIAVVHCGWRGLCADVLGAAVTAMGSSDGPVRAVVGPAVCGSCYPVPDARAAEVRAVVSPNVTRAAVGRARNGQPSIDVRAGVVARLGELGVATTVVGGCTVEDYRLFSHRRDGVTGRHGMIVTMRADGDAS